MKTIPLFSFAVLLSALAAQADPAPTAKGTSVAVASRQPDAVVFDRPRADGPLWACGHAWKASFDGRGFTAIPFFGSEAPRNFPLRLEVERATVGGEALPLTDGEPKQADQRVATRRGAFTEVVDTNLDQLEQSFVFDTLPNRGAIVVDVRIGGEFAVTPIDGGLRFHNDSGHVDYTKAIAVDAIGRRLSLPIEWTGEVAHLEIPASFVATATLPIVLDPTLNFWFGLGNPAQLQHDGDVATIEHGGPAGRTLLVWQRQWSLTDQDCWGLLFDNDLGLVQTDFTLDFTAEDWLKVAVAGNDYDQNFLVVSEVRIGLLWFIAGRSVAASGAVGAQFDIEREGVVGTPGNNFHPDVGGDPYFGVGRYTVVFNKKTLGVSDIYMRQVTPAGGLVTTNAVALSTATEDESRPSIGKSCGPSNGPPASWLITWQRTWAGAPNDQEVWGRFVDWNGVLGATSFGIGITTSEETAPSAGSPIDVGGQRLWPLCYEIAALPGQPRDLVGKLVRFDGLTQHTFTVSNNVPNADDRDPEVDSDGNRFAVACTTGTPGFPQQIETATFAFLPGSNTIRVEERTGLNTSSADDYGQCNLVADFSGGVPGSTRYKVALTHTTSNTLQLVNYAGQTGGGYFGVRPTQCGNLAITASGSTALGETVQFTVANGFQSGTYIGFPGSASLLLALGCNCTLGVDSGSFTPNPLTWKIPNEPLWVGLTFSVQGFTIVGSSCMSQLDLSDTIDFTLR